MFPQPLVLAATFDPDLARDVYAAISDELRAKHNSELASTGQAK
jgi:beta-glucosidase-like glycosyl hydrolase